jgi:hypothetical protein
LPAAFSPKTLSKILKPFSGQLCCLPLHVTKIDLLALVDTVSQKPCFLETEVSGPTASRVANDHVIKEVDGQNSCTLCDSFGELQIRC